MVALTTSFIMAATALLPALVSGTPVPEPQPQPATNPCSPSFQGVSTYIQAYDTYNRLWVPAGSQQTTVISTLSAAPTTWRFEGSGSAANDYVIKQAGQPANTYLIQAWRGKTVSLGLVQGSGNPTFDIRCNKCFSPGNIPPKGTFIGDTCFIIEHSTGLYLTETPASGGKGTLSRVARNGKTNQVFHIVAA